MAAMPWHCVKCLRSAAFHFYCLSDGPGGDPADVEVRHELAERYREIGGVALAEFWEQAAASAEALAETQ